MTMDILIGCEKYGKVRDAFIELGHNAVSIDITGQVPGPNPYYNSNFVKGDVLEWLDKGWDMAIFFPPCTNLAVSGARWFKDKAIEQKEAIDFFMALVNAPIPRIAIENPIGIMSSRYRKPDQIIQPWMFGHGETKATCLWLKGLPKLTPTNIVNGREGKVWKMPPSENRGELRSITYDGIAKAMATQWGKVEITEDSKDGR